MHSNVNIKNVSWPHFSWPTLYMNEVIRKYVSHIQSNHILSTVSMTNAVLVPFVHDYQTSMCHRNSNKKLSYRRDSEHVTSLYHTMQKVF